MNNPYTIAYRGYVIEINESLNYIISKDGKVITKCNQIAFPTLPDAEVHAKLHINRIDAKNRGWDLIQ